MKVRPDGKGFEDYYVRQVGHGMPVYAGSHMQRGHGIGNVLGGLFRAAKPLLMNIGRQALRAGVSTAKPMLKRAAKNALKQGVGAVASQFFNPKSKGRAPKRRKLKGKAKPKRRPAKRDIFA